MLIKGSVAVEFLVMPAVRSPTQEYGKNLAQKPSFWTLSNKAHTFLVEISLWHLKLLANS